MLVTTFSEVGMNYT